MIQQTSKAILAALGLSAFALTGCIAREDAPADAPASESPESAAEEATAEDESDEQDTDENDDSAVADDINDLDPRDDEDQDEDPDDDESDEDDEQGSADLPSIELIPDDEDGTVFFSADRGFNPTLTRWIVDGDPAEESLDGVEIEVTRWNCLAEVQLDSWGEVTEGRHSNGDDELYDIEIISGENPESGGGTSATITSVQINENALTTQHAESDQTATTRHDSQVSRFAGMCDEVADFVLP